MAKRIPPTRKSSQDQTADTGEQYEQHALTHEDGDAETIGAQPPPASEGDADAQKHAARQSATRGAQTLHAQKQSDPAWLGASDPERPSQSLRVDWPEGTEGVETVRNPRDTEGKTMSGEAEWATGSRGRDGDEQGHANAGVRGRPQETANATVHARSRGPSSADVAVRNDVREALSEARDLEVSHVDVTVASGLVLLTGYVPERWMKHVVQTVVSKVPGVSGVDNRLHERRDKAMSRPGESQEGHKI
ncbi:MULTISPECIES: BON domain-containing protein [Pandoraea]|uniref:Transport-associated protein n=1 Tax=Pandoraea communis TaxID=2508297 RepID=A0A5E4YC58_9BURK|nr:MULTISPECIES: BON domain-containing protein [Pandoraea]EON11676.1 transport-associated protein [Pandoraea sp. SD6-2]VVE45743.1 transport-associated protein [Pandoraea communis]